MCFDLDRLKLQGFEGFFTFRSVRENYSLIPDKKGLYIIFCENSDIEFLSVGTGGFFKGRNPNVDITILEAKWVEDANALYIGRAGGIAGNGRIYNSTLHKRIKLYLKFGIGMPVGHWGGRYIWQLQDSENLLVAYKVMENENPVEEERSMLKLFKDCHNNRLPFANIV